MNKTRQRPVWVCGVLAGLLANGACAHAAQSAVANGAVGAPQAPAPAANAGPAPDAFFIQAFDVAGVTKLSSAEVERLVYDHVGPGRTKDDVEAARKALQDAYTAKGYGAVIVEIPVQDHDLFAQGVVQLAVSEAPVGQLRVTGARYHSLWVAREAVPALVVGEPINLKALQAQISTANHYPDRTLNPQFKPGKVSGEIDVDLAMEDERPIHANLDLNNDASPATSPLRLTAGVRYTNLFQAGQSAAFTYIVAPENPNDTMVFSGSYTIPILGSPWTFSISGYDSNSNVASAGGSAVLGNGFQVGARLLYRLPVAAGSQTFSFGFDFKDFKQKITVNGTLTSTAPLQYVPMEVQYALAGATEHTSYDFSLGTTVGLRAFHDIACTLQSGKCVYSDAFQNRQQYSYENFVRANFSANFSYAFKNDMIAAFKLVGQLADSHLVTNEQFSGGGLTTVRGFFSSEAVGDNGIEPSLELRSPSFATLFGHWLTDARVFAFTDNAFLHIDSPSAGAVTGYRLMSVGGGLRTRLFNRFTADGVVGEPLTNGPTTKKLHPRINFEIKGEF